MNESPDLKMLRKSLSQEIPLSELWRLLKDWLENDVHPTNKMLLNHANSIGILKDKDTIAGLDFLKCDNSQMTTARLKYEKYIDKTLIDHYFVPLFKNYAKIPEDIKLLIKQNRYQNPYCTRINQLILKRQQLAKFFLLFNMSHIQ